ncbi:hypothetical protein QBC43DRAFT_294196 [Cladorrhinum sp. PSN259]|nr:hypothetical protein QBC43DRAFT_294196 [Cladorrhinum sp. PSN259]
MISIASDPFGGYPPSRPPPPQSPSVPSENNNNSYPPKPTNPTSTPWLWSAPNHKYAFSYAESFSSACFILCYDQMVNSSIDPPSQKRIYTGPIKYFRNFSPIYGPQYRAIGGVPRLPGSWYLLRPHIEAKRHLIGQPRHLPLPHWALGLPKGTGTARGIGTLSLKFFDKVDRLSKVVEIPNVLYCPEAPFNIISDIEQEMDVYFTALKKFASTSAGEPRQNGWCGEDFDEGGKAESEEAGYLLSLREWIRNKPTEDVETEEEDW